MIRLIPLEKFLTSLSNSKDSVRNLVGFSDLVAGSENGDYLKVIVFLQMCQL